MNEDHTFRRYKDDEDPRYKSWKEQLFNEDTSWMCPTYVNRTPPCQGSCPSGEDIRGWLDIVRGIEKPPEGVSWQEYAFRRSTHANPFPAIMGRVCPAPCEDGCNRNQVEENVGINSVEQYIGDQGLKNKLAFKAADKDSGKRVAIIGAGPGGLAAAYQLRRKGHGVTIFDNHAELGGMMRYGIPGYRTPRDVLDGEINRIIDMGVETRMNTFVGRDISLEEIEEEYDAIVIAIGAQTGSALPIPGGDAENCISGVAFLEAFNDGRLQASAKRVVVVGGGDTAMDVVSVARRLGHISNIADKDRVENVVLGYTEHDVAIAAKRQGAEVVLAYRRPIEKMPAARHEVEAAMEEGVVIRGSVAPVEVVLDDNGRARALRVIEVEWEGNNMTRKEGSEINIECDLVVSAIGQKGNLEGMEALSNDWGLITPDQFYRVPDKPGYFVVGDIIKPHLLTTAIGHAAVACESIHAYLNGKDPARRPKVDVRHYDLLSKLSEAHLSPKEFGHKEQWGSDTADFAVHNYEDRSSVEVVSSDDLFLGHFEYTPRHRRNDIGVTAENVLGHFEERMMALEEDEAIKEADRCMSCGMCFECDNCVIYCPQDAVHRTRKEQATMGRYVYTDYSRCVGCHICAEVCPTGYIVMGMGV